MNRIYRVIWSKVRNAWVVSSELATSRGKGGRTVRGATAGVQPSGFGHATRNWRLRLAVLTALMGLQASVHAADFYWDANGTLPGLGNTGTWDLTNLFWNANSNGVSGPMSAWDNLGLDNAIFAGTGGTVTLGAPITANRLTFNVANYTLTGGTLTLAGATPSIVVSGVTTIASTIDGSAGLTKSGPATLTLSGNNTFSGGITLGGGGLVATTDAALGALSNDITIIANSSLNLARSTSRTVNINSGVTLGVQGAGTGSALFTGGGNVTLVTAVTMSNDASTYTGTTHFVGTNGGVANIRFTSLRNLGEASSLGAPTTVAAGTITFNGGNQYSDAVTYIGTGDSSNRNWILGGSTLRRIINNGSGTLSITGDMAMTQSAAFQADTADIELLGVLSGGGGAAFNAGVGRTITLGGAHTFTGVAGIGAGGVVRAPVLADAGTASSLGAGSSAIGVNGTLSYTGAGASSNRTWSFGGGTLRNDGSGALALSGDTSLTGNLTLGGSFTGGDNAISGDISGSGNLFSSGDATWVLSGTNTRTGTITVNGGTLRAGSATAFGTPTSITTTAGTLDLNGFNLSTTALTGTGGTLALGTANLDLNLGSGVSNTYGGTIAGTGSLTKLGAGTLTLTGANTYTGATTIGGGTLALDFTPTGPTSNIIAGSSPLVMSGGTLALTGAAGQNNSQSFSGLSITTGNNTVRAVSGTGGSTIVNLGTITRSGGLANFALPTSGAFVTSNSDGALGGWATVNGTDYAKVQGGNIIAFTADDYVNKDDAFTWSSNEIISDAGGNPNTPFFGTVNGSVQIGGLQYTAAANSTVTVGNSETLGVDGTIIVAPSVGNSSLTISGGSVTGTLGGGVLGVQQNGGASSNFTIASQIVDNTGSIGFTKAGTGRAALTGSNTYTGATTVSQGTLSVNSISDGGSTSAIGASSNAAANLAIQGATLEYTGGTATTDRGFTLARSGAITSSTIAVTNAGSDLTFTGTVESSDGANLIKDGAGTLTLSNGNNSYTGATTIRNGALAVTTLANGGVNSSLGASSSASSNLILDGGELRYTGATVTSDRGFTLQSSSRINVSDPAATLTLGGVAAGPAGFHKIGSGTLVLSGLNTFGGSIVVGDGVLRAGSNQAFSNAIVTVNSATLDLNNFSNTIAGLAGPGAVSLGSGNLTIGYGYSSNFSGTITGTGGLAKAGAGVQFLTGCNNDYTGITTVSAGTLSTDCLANGGVLSGIGASGNAPSNLVIGNATLAYTGDTVGIDRGFTVTGSNSYVSVTSGTTELDVTGQVTGTGRLRKHGAGTLVLSGTNNYTGGTVVDGGILRAGSTSAFGSGGVIVNTAGAMLDLAGFDNTFHSIAGIGNTSLGSATLTISHGNGQTYSGVLAGSGSLIKNGAGVQGLGGCDNTYGGGTTINGGILEVSCLDNGGTASSLGNSTAAASNLVLSGGGLRYVGDGSSTDRQFTLGTAGGTLDASGAGTVAFTSTAPITLLGTNAPRTLTLQGTNTGNNTLAAQIVNNGSGATSLTKTGVGTWVLTNPNSTYTGITRINGGVLAVDKLSNGGVASSMGASSNAASNLVIGNGSTLRYTGTGDTTDRLFTLDTGVTYIESSGSGAVVFSNTAPVTQSGSGARTIALGGSNTGDNTLGGSIGNGAGGITLLAKNDSGNWLLTGENTFTGNTNINGGILQLGNGGTTGSLASDNIINTAGTLAFNRSNTLTVGGAISSGGDVRQIGTGTTVLTGTNTYTGGTTISAGTLQLGGGGATGSVVGNVLNNSALAFNRSNTYTFGGLISGSGTLHQLGGGTTILTGDNTYTGATTVSAGTLLINGDQSGATGLTSVLNGGTLGGTGTIGGSVAVSDGGALNPGNSPGTLTINGNLALSAGSILNYEFGQANVVGGPLNDLTIVHGDLVLDGILNVSEAPGGSFGAGLYRIISYDGALTDNGLDLGTTPAGTYQVQTSVANQVNLLNSGGLVLNFWDGAAGPKGDGVVQGGNGTWQGPAGNDNWTDQTGTYNAPYTDSDFAIFMGAAGTVSVDNTLGAVRTSGMQFAVDGYILTGDPLTLTGASSLIRVGDGTSAGANMTATIDAVLTGSSAVVKGDAGTLVLSGANTYTGGTTIAAGTLEVSSDANLGDAAGDLAINGGTLRNTAAFASARGVTLDENGGTFATLADLSLTGTIDGAGALTKTGAGVLTLSGTNTYAGGTNINAGTVSVSSDVNLGHAAGALTLDAGILRTTAAFASARNVTLGTGGGTLQTFADLTLSGPIGGSGGLTKTGGGSLTLTGDNTYGGGTTIAGGTLQLGAGGTSGSIAGDVINNGALIFNRANTYTFGGLISGTGALEQIGTGTTVLTGNNTYGGVTAVRAGSLIINGNQSAASAVTSVDNGGTLGGSGVIGGDVMVDHGGALSPGNVGAVPGTLTINGSLALSDGSFLRYNFGQANVVGGAFNDLVRVGGDLVLDGILEVETSPGGSFDAGIYRIIGYAGTLTDNGLIVGSVPTSDFFLQTSVAQQINLVNTAGLSLNFWDGEGARSDGAIQGGDGWWQSNAGNDNWTDDTGGLNAPYRDGDFAIFTGTAGLVVVDNSLGEVTAAGLQFAVDGYELEGDALKLVGTSAVVRVGDGTTEGPGMTAIVRAELTGDVELVKSDLGTLVLAGENSYTGNTRIVDGTLQLGEGGVSGSILGDVQNNATLAFNRSNLYAFDGLISGSGGLQQIGSGTTILTGNNTYVGPTTVQSGTLLIEGNQSAATGLTSVLSGATLGGTGIIGGDVTVASGGTLSPGGLGNSAGTLTINGGLTLGSGSTLNYHFGQANVVGGPLNDLLRVGGDLVLDGTLDVSTTPGGNFDAGIYRVISYDGTLSGNGLVIGTSPSPDVYVQTSVANQVNLVNTAGLELNFWDGASGTANDGAIHGGNGVWRLANNDYWTTDTGAVNARYQGGAFAVFMGAPGTVTIDNSNGQVQASGLQFAVDGYTIDGEALTLTGVPTVVRVGDGTATGADMTATIAAELTGASALVKTDLGTLTLAGANTYTGTTTVQAGRLLVAGDQSGATGLTAVHSGATLGGTGVVGGDVTVADGGVLSPGAGAAAGTLTINGGVTLNDGSILDYRFGQANIVGGPLNDLLRVGGDLVLDGTINVSTTAGGNFGAGIYRLISYDGVLTNNGLALGSMPNSDVRLQTALANQVNLVSTSGLSLGFWDGAGGSVNDGVIDGGSGVWRLDDNDYWTDDAGAVNGPYANSAFAVFMGAPGIVTIDNANGDVAASGLQFAVDGYALAGDPLTMTGGAAIVRVGDGTVEGRSMTATIRSVLDGASALEKTDAGTLVLAGENTYAGGTTISAGTLQLGEGGVSGSIDGDVVNHGMLAFNRSDTYTFGGAISGSGVIEQRGIGTTILTSTHSHTGGTIISAGTLQVDGVLSGTAMVNAGGTLSGTGTVGSVTTVAGGVVAPGNSATPFGTLTLSGNYAGAGIVSINAELGDETSAASRLVIQGNTTGATSQVLVNRLGGGGAATSGDGIAIIQVDGVSQADSFRLMNPVQAGAYEYLLYQGGSTDANDWYLRSELIDSNNPDNGESPTPAFRAGVPGYVLGHQANLEYGYTALGSLRARVGDKLRMGGAEQHRESDAWMRMYAHELDVAGTRFSAQDLQMTTLQFGTDLYTHSSGDASSHFGAMASVGESRATLFDNARSIAGLSTLTGKVETQSLGGGLYWTHFGARGGYFDLAGQLLHFTNRYSDQSLTTARQSGWSGTLSAELGAAYALGKTGWRIEPQVQLGYQRLELEAFADNVSNVDAVADDGLRARAAVQLLRAPTDWLGMRDASPYIGLGVQHDLRDASAVTIGGTRLNDVIPDTTGDVSVGFTGSVLSGVELHLNVLYQKATEGERDGVRANFGFRMGF